MTIVDNEKLIKKCNKSMTYLLPLLNKEVNIDYEHLLINTYIKYNKWIGDIDNTIGLLYELNEDDGFINYSNYLETHPLLWKVMTVDYVKILFIFKFPEKYLNEYKLFKQGKYSKFSVDAKAIIIAYSAVVYKYPPLLADITGVLWKHKTRRDKLERELNMNLPKDCELASKMNIELETFNFTSDV